MLFAEVPGGVSMGDGPSNSLVAAPYRTGDLQPRWDKVKVMTHGHRSELILEIVFSYFLNHI